MKCKILGILAWAISLSSCELVFHHYLEEGQVKYDAGDYAGAYEKWYVLAQHGSVEAKYMVGVMCYLGHVARCKATGLPWIEDAANQGNAHAQRDLAILHLVGGLDYFGANEKQERRLLGILYPDHEEDEYILGVEDFPEKIKVDYEKVFYYASLAAKQGDATGCAILGDMYKEGVGVEQDYVQSVKWYQLAAEQGHEFAQGRLGDFYRDGKGVERDYQQAVYWYRLAAGNGYEAAQRSLGDFYRDGTVVERDYRKAAYWYAQAAEQGNQWAQRSLGYLFYAGLGVDQNDVQAVRWYKLAVNQDNQWAQLGLGRLYHMGRGVDQDYVMATGLYRDAAVQGNRSAQRNLGVMSYCRLGFYQDYEDKANWLQLALDQGDPFAGQYLERIEKDYSRGYDYQKSSLCKR